LSTHLRTWLLIFVGALSMLPMSSFAQSSMPDLVASRIWIGDKSNTPIVARAGQPFYVCVTVKNIGNAYADGFYVQPYFGGSPLAAGGPGRLDAGGAQDWASGPVTVGPGNYEVRWVLNPDRKVSEANYGNNEIAMIVAIEAASPVETPSQPIVGPIGLTITVAVILVAGVALGIYLRRRRRRTAQPKVSSSKNSES